MKNSPSQGGVYIIISFGRVTHLSSQIWKNFQVPNGGLNASVTAHTHQSEYFLTALFALIWCLNIVYSHFPKLQAQKARS